MKVIPTGICGLNKIIGGGYLDNSAILITGGPGTGKSIFGLQYLYDGLKNNENCLFVAFEENRDMIIQQAKKFGWDFEDYIKKNKLKILNFDMPTTHVAHVIEQITKEVKNHKPKRLVLDSISVLSLFSEVAASVELAHSLNLDLKKVRLSREVLTMGAIMGLLSRIKKYDNTSLIIAEIPEGRRALSRDSYTEFICDGVIKLHREEKTGQRWLYIVKLRATDHKLTPFKFTIGKKGIELK